MPGSVHPAIREQTGGFLDRSFVAIRMKVGRERLSEDVERVAVIREKVGPARPTGVALP